MSNKRISVLSKLITEFLLKLKFFLQIYFESIQGTLDHLKRVIDDERVKIIPRSGSKEPDPVRVMKFLLID